MANRTGKGVTMNLRTAQELAQGLMKDHGLEAKGWAFSYDNAVRRFGATHYSTKRITLSRTLTELNTVIHVKDVILHEIAHALVPRGVHHGKTWKRKAAAIGCSATTYYSTAVVKPAKKVTGTCSNCSRVIERNRRDNIACGKCCDKYNGGKYTNLYKIIWN